MSLLDWLIRVTDFPSCRHLDEGTPGSPAVIQRHLEVLLASRRWNHLYFEEADNTGDVIRDHVAVTKSFNNPRLQVEVNISSKRQPSAADMLTNLKRLLPFGYTLNVECTADDNLVVDTRQDTTKPEQLAQLIDATYREVYGYARGYKLLAVAQYVKWRRL